MNPRSRDIEKIPASTEYSHHLSGTIVGGNDAVRILFVEPFAKLFSIVGLSVFGKAAKGAPLITKVLIQFTIEPRGLFNDCGVLAAIP